MKPETIYEIILSVLSGEATGEEQRLLKEWLARSEANRRQFEQVSKLYRDFNVVDKEDDLEYDVEQAWKKVSSQTVGRRKQLKLKYWLSYAALLALLFSVGIYFMTRPVEQDWTVRTEDLKNISQPTLLLDNGEQIPLKQDSFSIQQGNMVIRNNLVGQLSYESDTEQPSEEIKLAWNHLVIPKGNAYELELADGTHVWLNAESELSYPTCFAGETREVRLKGEAYFDVAKNPDCPFVVKIEDMAVRVLGTSFNVSAYPSEQKAHVTLVDGSVAVKVNDKDELRIVPSQQFCYDKKSRTSDVQIVDTDLYTSWIKGEYIFKNATLDEIFNKLSHWYDFSVQYEYEQLKDKRFSLLVDRRIGLDQLLELVSFTSDVELEQSESNIIYVKRKKEGGIMA